jgi:predicted ATPase/signal transduction histidine kinase/tRNA A-37 threonylcarbamoyl transferase component Bud32
MRRIDTAIDGRYHITEQIGEGGMSIVFQATDKISHQNVVLKFMKEKVTSSHIEDIIRFKREIEIVTKFNHPNIIKIYGSGEFENRPYIAMELLVGNNLADLLHGGIQFDFSETAVIVKQITEALIYVHHHGIIHRDLKPSNIFVYQEEGQAKVKLLDFGIAQVMELGAIKGEKEVIGTFGYMSPEATGILDNRIDERSDLYSLGVVFYHLLTGMLPFKGNHVNQIIHQQVALTPPRPCKINDKIPAVFDAIVVKLLQKDPDLRYQSAGGLWADLERYRNGELRFEIGAKDQKIKLTYQTRLIGRETELAAIKELINRTKSGHGNICLIAGEAGIGKSRIVEEIKSLVYEKNELFISGRCINCQNKTPYQPFKDAIDDYLSKLERWENETKYEEVDRLKNRWVDLGEIIIRLNSRLEKYIGVPKMLPPLEAERENQRFLMVLADFFCSLASPGTICVLFLDDLQWADEGSLNLLEELLRKVDNSNLLILGTYRDHEIAQEHGLERLKLESKELGTALTEIKLDPFNRGQLNKLIACLLNEKEERACNLTGYIFDKSGGNPFFAINIFRELIENKAISWKEGYWEEDWEVLSKWPVSSTMLNIILKRTENLTPEQNELLCKGAVIGREFAIELLYPLTDFSQATVVTLIDEFIAKQLLERSSNRGKVMFVHDQIRDAFYQQLTETERRQIHLQIAGAIEKMNGNLDEVIFDLAHHYAEGGDREKMLQFMLPAADKAKKSYANEAAIKYYKTAIDILESKDWRNSEWFQAKENLAEVCLTIGKFEEAVTISKQLLPLATGALAKARIYKKMGVAFFKKGDWVQCEDSLARGLELLGVKIPRNNIEVAVSFITELTKHLISGSLPKLFYRKKQMAVKDEDKEIMSIYITLNWMYILSDVGKLPCNVLRMLNISEQRIGKSIELGLSMVSYAGACMAIPLFNRAFQYHKKALNIRKELDDEWGTAQSLQLLGFNCFWSGNNKAGIKHLEQAETIFQKLGDMWELGITYDGLGYNYFCNSDYHLSIKAMNQYLVISRKLKNSYGIASSLCTLSGNYIEKGDFRKAQDLLTEAKKISKENSIWLKFCYSLFNMGYLELERNHYDNAIESLEQAKKVYQANNLLKPYTVNLFYYLADARIKKFKEQNANIHTQNSKTEIKQIFRYCREAIKETRPWPNHYGGALRATANCYRIAGRNNKAERYFLKSIAHDQKINRKYELAKDHFEYGNFLESLKRFLEAKEHWQRAHAIFKSIGAAGYTQKTAILLDCSQNEVIFFDELTAKDRLKIERRMNTVLTTSNYINSILDIDELLARIMEIYIESIGAEKGILFLYPENGGNLEIAVSKNLSNQEIQNKLVFSNSIVNKVAHEKTPLILSDASSDQVMKVQWSVIINKIRSVICAPIMNKGAILGVIYLENNQVSSLFSEEDLEVLTLISNQAGISIENARLYGKLKLYSQEVERSRDQITQWNQTLEKRVAERTEQLETANRELKEYAAAVEELSVMRERNRIAREVHDTIGQTLSILANLLQSNISNISSWKTNPEKIENNLVEANRIVKQGLIELRWSVSELMHDKVDLKKFIATLERLFKEYHTLGMKVDFSFDELNAALSPRYFNVLYRICQEALTNSLKHGKATEVNIILRLTNRKLKLFIFDNGIGCDHLDLSKGFGLMGMKQRIEELKGKAVFGSNGEQGFNVNVEIPLEDVEIE